MSSSPSKASPTSVNTRATSSSERTSHSVTAGEWTLDARSRTPCSIRSPWYVNASFAPPSESTFAIAQAIERLFATPSISPRLPSNAPAIPGDPTVPSADLRRVIPLLVTCAALLGAASAAAQPVRIVHTGSRVRVGTLPSPSGSSTHVRVIVRLSLPPLAARDGRGLNAFGVRRKLDFHSQSTQAYLRRVAQQQSLVARQIREAIPQARIGRRFQVLLNGLTVALPAAKLPSLLLQRAVTKVYPSVPYTLALDHSPSVIGSDVLRETTGADGTGMKIGVVDDGIDQTNRFFSPTGFAYPPGFPRGSTKWTSPKVIVARVFPGPNSGSPGRLGVDPNSSFHGTHLAGIATGVSGP